MHITPYELWKTQNKSFGGSRAGYALARIYPAVAGWKTHFFFAMLRGNPKSLKKKKRKKRSNFLAATRESEGLLQGLVGHVSVRVHLLREQRPETELFLREAWSNT